MGINTLQAAVRAGVRPRQLHPATCGSSTGACGAMAYLGGLSLLLALWGGWLLHRKRLAEARGSSVASVVGIAIPLPLELRRLDPYRGGPSAVGRLRAAEDDGRDLAERHDVQRRAQPRRLHDALRDPRSHRLLADAHGTPESTRPSSRADRRSSSDGRAGVLVNLQILWFWILCLLWTGYFVLEGFDFGVGMLLPVSVGRRRIARRCSRRSARSGTATRSGSSWPGGATFAAFPQWYATMFSGFYLALLLILVLLIVRVLSFEWRERSRAPAGGRPGRGRTRSARSAHR